MPQISGDELKALLKTFPLYVHFDKSEWKEIERAECSSNEGKKIFEEYRDRYLEEAFSLNQDEKMAQYKKSDNWAFQSGLVS